MSTACTRRKLLLGVAVLGSGLATSLLAACQAATQPTPAPAARPTEPAKPAPTSAPGAAPTTAATTAVAKPAASQAPAAAPVSGTLRVWGYGLDDARAKARVAEFTRANPGVDVQPVGGQLNTQQLLTAVASGDPPEVVNVDRFQTGSWAGRNAIDPLDDLISRDKFDLTQFYPFTIEQVKYKNQVYGIPQFVNMDLLFLQADVLQQAGIDPSSVDPGNWEQLQQLGEQLAQKSGDKVTRTGFDTKMQDGRLWLWSWANGVDLIAEGDKANFNDPKVVDALSWAKDTVDKQGGEKARAAFAQSQNFFSPDNPILVGQVAMTIFEQWLIGVLKAKPDVPFRTLLPTMHNGKDPLTDATGTAFAIPKGIKGDKREAAWAFIKGMTSTDAWVAGERATYEDNKSKNTPYHPTITGNIKADEEAWNRIYTSINPSYDQTVKLFPDALKAARFRYSGPVAAQIADLMTSSVNDALQGVKGPKDALDDLQKKAQQAIDDFKKGPGNR